MLVWRLTFRQLLVRRVRTLLTLLAIAFAVSLVVAVTTGFSSLTAVALRMVDRYMGSTDVFITARDVQRTTFPESVLADVRADPRVRRAIGRFETPSPIVDAAGDAIVGRPAMLVGLVPGQDDGGTNLTLTAGRWFSNTAGNEVVLNGNVARALASTLAQRNALPPAKTATTLPVPAMLKPGDTFTLPGPSGGLKLTVVGVVHQPEIAGNTVYLPLDTLRNFVVPQDPKVLSRVMVELKKGSDLAAFEKDWSARLREVSPTIRVKLARTNKEQLENNLMGLTMLSAVGVSVSLVSAACIVFSTLSMGVAERQRQLAMLRAVGATKGLVGRLVVLEGLLLGTLGVAVGVPLGVLWVELLTLRFPQVFTQGVVISWLGVTYALVAVIVTALVATVLPAWHASRVSPLEAMSPLAESDLGRGWPWRSAVTGLLLACVDLLILSPLFPPVVRLVSPGAGDDIVRGAQFWGHYAAGVPLTMIGFFLLAPMAVRLIEAVLVPVAARVMALPTALLRQQLAGGLWRAVGTACALMVGLATLVVMQTQGRSALSAWRLPDKFPDVFILHRGLGGLTPPEIDKLAATPGLIPGDLMPIAIASPTFGSNFLAIAGAAMMPESTLFFGIDPAQARRMTELEFRQGDPDTATKLIAQGRHVLVTEEYRQVRNVNVGDTLELSTRTSGVQKFTIAGIVWSPGIDVIVSLFDLGGSFEQRTAYSVFGSIDDARNLFGVKDVSIFAANLTPGIEREELTKRLQQEVGKMGLQAFDIRQIKAGIQTALGNLLLMASSVAFAALFVASLGVTNTIMASIRSRRWQFGVLRAVGVTRGQLLRLVLAESALLALAAVTLGLACGAVMTLQARAATTLFIGFTPEVVLPWGMLAIGVGSVITVALLASLYPAGSTSRKPVLDLLQAGRASA